MADGYDDSQIERMREQVRMSMELCVMPCR